LGAFGFAYKVLDNCVEYRIGKEEEEGAECDFGLVYQKLMDSYEEVCQNLGVVMEDKVSCLKL